MSWNIALSGLDAAVFGTFGSDGTYAPASGATPFPVRVIVDRNVEVVGEFGQIGEPAPVLTMLKSQVPTPRRDDEVTVAGETFIVIRLFADDGQTIRCVATEITP